MKTLHLHHQMFRTSNDGTPLIWNQILAHLNLDDPLKHHPTEIRLYCNSAEVWECNIEEFEKDCEDCDGNGYVYSNDENWNDEIQKCDTCNEFSSDKDAQDNKIST